MAEIDELIKRISAQMAAEESTQQTATVASTPQTEMKRSDYPLFEKHPDIVRSPSGKGINEITLDKVLAGEVDGKDLRITRETLKYQGQIASDAGRDALQENFKRAAELTAIPDERLLEMYGELRPYRSSKVELLAMADELETKYNAKITADFVREAAEYYETRKKLKGDN
ncbi:diol dehydratase small subunit [Enterococcus faecium]|uniref:Diol dehydratase small subunit n=1 Tax=Enterococcus pseudoavium TaxID=44007 RepID=A0AAE4L4E0_9ENTE|nr:MULTISPECIES: diol dehydratase small subunit [Enterococcus]EGP4965691.1 diol dehydratase small subunit [Enterococcus faecium]EGP5666953.1 propanediol dehydratase small subunit PduE [Enterococcus faecium]EGW0027090.1 diol dehydratase small subunit [Enterococcus faecium]EHV0153946.1 diol dehydratase small subunit [Enterococcus faecalis]MCA6746223.1 diol dehydratase small subunit [Enterococcus lactis]